MPSKALMREVVPLSDNSRAELVIWEVDPAVRASNHNYKYRLAYIVDSTCVLRYDNEAGKGDHKHIGSEEIATTFTTVQQLLADFWADVRKYGG
ncbi:hypothetical protein DOE59_16565 [Salmonella enterica subsp. diarizonae serovar 48:i:z]|uniref:Uncharacterized protein n=3 Tax=Salmonella enterica TaxID=28901 RepID=A0A7U6BDU8_SALDZ|nr:hypothetical protein DOE63_01880 [Salmonella enterica subsp. diarizonae serovar 59:z10:-]AXC73034.1 hypothetical protein DOE59_16565 [Salmonella enterica subsp. diarizonae serovar 48:i:z]EAO8183690.1 hypothetical protein [Salmonella enterica]EAW1261874.1 hypothetical protein [Salmonella enterica subsp. diarizonae]ECF2145120.1 hypothetical protein [Salmonella enterica subsp. enterica serovar Newport]ECI8027201.1 hypothetical protein [Salmonella enterica subsp. enterica serovar Ramatgan]EHL2